MLDWNVLPAFIALIISGLLGAIYLFPKWFSDFWDQYKLQIFSLILVFTFFVSLFISQYLYEFIKQDTEVSLKWLSTPPFTAIATATGIYLGNTTLRYFADQKQRKEVAITLTNSISVHKTPLTNISDNLALFDYGESVDKSKLKVNIDVYLTRLEQNSLYDIVVKDVGIYNKDETELLSKYFFELKDSILFVKSFLDEENFLLNRWLTIRFDYLSILASLCIFLLSSKYYSSNLEKDSRNLIMALEKMFNRLILKSNIGGVVCWEKHIVDSLINYLTDIKLRCIKMKINLPEIKENKPLYICYCPMSDQGNLSVLSIRQSKEDAEEKVLSFLRSRVDLSNEEVEMQTQKAKTIKIFPWID